MKWAASLSIGIGVVTLAPTVIAAPSSRLVYARAEEADDCPDVSAFRKAVSARIGYDPFFPSADIAVTAAIRSDARDARRLVGHVALVDAEGIVRGSREITVASGDCAELVSSMALAVSIALDSLSSRADTPPASDDHPSESPAAPDAAPPASIGSSSRSEVSDAPRRPSDAVRPTPARLTPLVGAGVVGAVGWAPAPTAGFTLTGGLRFRSFAVELEGRAHLPASTSGPAGGEVRAELYAATLLPCLHAGVVFGCGVLSADFIRASGVGVPTPREASTVFVAAGGRLGIELALGGPLFARGYVELGVPIARPTLRVAGADAWSPSILSGSLGLGVLAKFP